MTHAIKLVIAALCGQLWVFLCCAFVATTFDFTQWEPCMRFLCVMLGVPAAFLAAGLTGEI